MTSGTPPSTSATGLSEVVEEQLIAAGWPPAGIIRDAPTRDLSDSPASILVLTYAAFPMAFLTFDTGDEIAPEAHARANCDARSQFPISLVTDGTSTWKRGARNEIHWHPVPSPKDLWTSLGIPWTQTDPRLAPSHFDLAPSINQSRAIGCALDALARDERRIQIVMPFGSGRSRVVEEILWKLLSTNTFSRALLLTLRRELALQCHSNFWRMRSGLSIRLLPDEEARPKSNIDIATHAAMLLPTSTRFESFAKNHYDLVFYYSDFQEPSSGLTRILQHFEGATVIGMSSTRHTLPILGEVVFEMPLEEAIDSTFLRPPPGFRTVQLGSIATIQVGLQSATIPRNVQVQIVNARSIQTITTEPRHLQTLAYSRGEVSRTLTPLEKQRLDPYRIKNGDILISTLAREPADSARIATVSPSEEPYGHNSIAVIRITDADVTPDNVLSYIRSDAGRNVLRILAPAIGSHVRISTATLASLPIFLPDRPAPTTSTDAETTPPRDDVDLRAGNNGSVEPNSMHQPRLDKAEPSATTPEPSLSATATALRIIEETIIPQLRAATPRTPAERSTGGISTSDIAEQLRRVAETLTKPTLSELVIERFPMPIALAYRRFQDSRFNVYEQVLRLRDVFEAAAYFVYNATLADYFRRLAAQGYKVKDSNAKNAYEKASMAYRIGFVEQVCNLDHSRKQDSLLFIPEIRESSFCKLAREMQSDFRNQISHSSTAGAGRQRALLEQFTPTMEELLNELRFLENYRLARIPELYLDNGRYTRRVEVFMGVTPVLDEQVFEKDQQPELAEREHIVILDENDDHLDLYPLYQFLTIESMGHETHMCYMKQRKGGALQGESVQTPIEIELGGFRDFEVLKQHAEDS